MLEILIALTAEHIEQFVKIAFLQISQRKFL